MKCDYCELKAVANYQKVWIKFKMDKNANYKEDRDFDGAEFEQPICSDNVHLCKKHDKEWLNGNL